MDRTVAYQETANDFLNKDQRINGDQITSMKTFGFNNPIGSGEYEGQLGLQHTPNGHSRLYVSGQGTWAMVGTTEDKTPPDEVVREDRDNNFTVKDQTILHCQITYMESGALAPNLVPIKGVGHFYVYETTPAQVFVSYDGANWTRLRTHEDNSDFVTVGNPNDFTDPHQTINHRPLVTVVNNSLNPVTSNIVPTRDGEMYIQIAEGTTDGKARMWVANPNGGMHWEELTHLYDLPATVAQTNKGNDFQTTNQYISGKQIMSFVDGGELTPEQSKLPADYNGQFYIAIKQLSGGKWDAAIWVARDNTWVPFASGSDVDTSRLAKLAEDNTFDGVNTFNNTCMFGARINLLGSPVDSRMIGGTRVKRDRAPIADAGWKAYVEGEETIYINGTEISVWKAVYINPNPDTNAGEWVMTWTNKDAGHLPANVAVTDKANTFVPLQKMGTGGNEVFLTGARRGTTNPQGSVVPMAYGELYIRRFVGTNDHEIYYATEEADTDSWVRIYDNALAEELLRRVKAIEDEDTYIHTLITNMGNDMDRLANTIGILDGDMTSMDMALNNMDIKTTNIDNRTAYLEAKVVDLETRLAALEARP